MSLTAPVSNSVTGAQLKSQSKQLQTQDFIKLMMTQLQNQDPLNPTSNQDLMAQMSQIGQLQNNTQMQTLLTNLGHLNQMSSAGGMIGKMVEGLDDNNDPVQGLVTSVRIKQDQVMLELDSGKTIALDNVTFIGPAATPASGTPVAA